MKRATFNWKLPAAIEARLGSESYGAQRAIHEDEHLLLVLHRPPAGAGHQREPAIFLRQAAGKWLHHGAENGDFALRQLLDAYRQRLEALAQELDKAASADELFHVLDQAIPLARAAANMKDALQSARERVRHETLLIDARDQAVDIARGFELLLADARLALDYRLARNAEEQVQAALAVSRGQHKLNVLAALTLPLMTLTTVFGMNLRSGLEGLPAWLFWAVLGGGIVLGFGARAWADPGKAAARTAPAGSGKSSARQRKGRRL